jgi:hypothetical protein
VVPVQALPSEQVTPLLDIWYEQAPVAGLQTPESWQIGWPTLQSTAAEPVHVPLWQV